MGKAGISIPIGSLWALRSIDDTGNSVPIGSRRTLAGRNAMVAIPKLIGGTLRSGITDTDESIPVLTMRALLSQSNACIAIPICALWTLLSLSNTSSAIPVCALRALIGSLDA